MSTVNQKTPGAGAVKSSKKYEKSIQIKPTGNSVGPQIKKAPGWLTDEKYCYTDKHVQTLLKDMKKDSSSKRPKHQPRVVIKMDDKLIAEAAKINEMIEKMNFQMPDDVIKTNQKGNDLKDSVQKQDLSKDGKEMSKTDNNPKSDVSKAK